jgi:hypothetical protein
MNTTKQNTGEHVGSSDWFGVDLITCDFASTVSPAPDGPSPASPMGWQTRNTGADRGTDTSRLIVVRSEALCQWRNR